MYISKTKSAHTQRLPSRTYYQDHPDYSYADTGYANVGIGAETITYRKGPAFYNHHCIWKDCDHTCTKAVSGDGAIADIAGYIDGGKGVRGVINYQPAPDYQPPSRYPQLPSLSEVMEGVWNQIDLNHTDSVLLYSGILQAIPLVGGAFNFVKVMNRVGRHFTRSFKKKPFTTVLKTAISADFINRFVVRPTIDDAQKFLDAHNYVMNVMNTAIARSGHVPTAYSHRLTNWGDRDKGEFSRNMGSDSFGVRFHGSYEQETFAQTSVFVLADTRYDVSAIDPIRIWANKVGITKPLDSIWDLVPFSFVIDYFSRAGDFISGLSDEMASQGALQGTVQKLEGSWYCNLQSARRTEIVTSCDGWSPTKFLRNFVPGSISVEGSIFSRHQFNPFEIGAAKHNMFSIDLSKTQARTIAELIIQAKL